MITSRMNVWDAIMELAASDKPQMPVRARVTGRQVECYNHNTDMEDYVDFEKESSVINFVEYNGVMYVEVEL